VAHVFHRADDLPVIQASVRALKKLKALTPFTGQASSFFIHHRTALNEGAVLPLHQVPDASTTGREISLSLLQSGAEGRSSSMLDDTDRTNFKTGSEAREDADKIRNQCSTCNVADDVVCSTPQRRHNDGSGVSPLHITIDDAIASSPDSSGENPPEKLEPPSSPRDAAGQRSSMFSKRAGVTPVTPPAKESHSKKMSSPVHHEPKSKGCCAIF